MNHLSFLEVESVFVPADVAMPDDAAAAAAAAAAFAFLAAWYVCL